MPEPDVLGESVLMTEQVAIAAFVTGYRELTRKSYATDLRIFATWCHEHGLGLMTVRRPHLELFARWMEEQGRMPSTIGRRLSTLSTFYRYCEVEELLDKNPAAHLRRPRVSTESRTLGLDRHELGALLVQAGLGDEREGALITLLALNGLRISEALNANIEDLTTERGHRTLTIIRKRPDPRTTMRYDRARQSLDRHATYVVSTFLAGATRPG